MVFLPFFSLQGGGFGMVFYCFFFFDLLWFAFFFTVFEMKSGLKTFGEFVSLCLYSKRPKRGNLFFLFWVLLCASYFELLESEKKAWVSVRTLLCWFCSGFLLWLVL